MFKVGDVVNVIADRAWSRALNRVETERVRKFDANGKLNTFKVLGVKCLIPVKMNAYADTLIQTCDASRLIYAINGCNLCLQSDIAVRFVSAGIDITDEMSEQSKRAVLKAHNY